MVECFMLFFILLACLINWHVEKRETLLLHQVTHVNDSMTQILNKSCHAWVMSRVSHVTHMRESCHVHTWVMSPDWFGRVTWLIKMIPLSSWVMLYMSGCHGTHMRESCHTCLSTMSHAWIRMIVSHLFFCDRLSDQLPCMHGSWADKRAKMWHIHPYSCVWHGYINRCDMTRAYVYRDPRSCITWLMTTTESSR